MKKFPIHLGLTITLLLAMFSIAWAKPPASHMLAASVNPPSYDTLLANVDIKSTEIKQKNKQLKQQLEDLRAEKEKLQLNLKPDAVNARMLESALLDMALAKANLDGAEIAVTEAQQMIDASTVKISSLENELRNTTFSPIKPSLKRDYLNNLQIQLNYERTLKKVQQLQADDVQRGFDLTRQILQVQKDWKNYLESLYQVQRQQQQRDELRQEELQLKIKQEYWEKQLTDLTQQITILDKDSLDAAGHSKLQLAIFEAQERSNLVHLELVFARLSNQVQLLMQQQEQDLLVTELNASIHQASVLAAENSGLEDLVKRKLKLIEERREAVTQNHEQAVITSDEFRSADTLFQDLYKNYQRELNKTSSLAEQIRKEQGELQKELNRALSRRQGLPDLSVEAWQTLGYRLMLMPGLTWEVMNAIWEQGLIAFSQLTYWQISGIILLEMLLAFAWYYLRDFFEYLITRLEKRKQSIVNNTLYILLELVRRNFTGLSIFSGLALLCWLSGMPTKSYLPIIYIGLIWFVFKISINFARIILVENTSDVSGHDVRLYTHLKWASVAGVVLTMLTVLSHQLPVVYEVKDFFSRLFMLFLLLVALLLLKNYSVIPKLLVHYMDGSRPYLMRVVRLLSFLIPLTLLSMAIIGFLGYVDLAWTISKYAGMFLLVLTIYVLARGLLIDLMQYASELFIRRSRNGWLWNQAILKPLDKLLRMGLFFLTIFVLFMLYGWDSNSVVVIAITKFLDFRLLVLEGVIITPLGILDLVIAGIVLFWVARWTREFAYRWMFARTRDLGLRNSLSSLTQYTVVILGILIALKVIGVDFTAISYILTALAFGIGFGLRDLAKNYVCGVLLLMERPVSVGDFITVGTCEGEVSYIGTRSMIVKSWDNMDVLVPNSEIFEKQVTNWTHHDSVLRTVVLIKVRREEDPDKVQQLVLGLLKTIPQIMPEPEAQMFLKDIHEGDLEFELRYFINLQQNNTLASVRSLVLFAIWDCFEKNQIYPPHPQHEVHLKSDPE